LYVIRVTPPETLRNRRDPEPRVDVADCRSSGTRRLRFVCDRPSCSLRCSRRATDVNLCHLSAQAQIVAVCFTSHASGGPFDRRVVAERASCPALRPAIARATCLPESGNAAGLGDPTVPRRRPPPPRLWNDDVRRSLGQRSPRHCRHRQFRHPARHVFSCGLDDQTGSTLSRRPGSSTATKSSGHHGDRRQHAGHRASLFRVQRRRTSAICSGTRSHIVMSRRTSEVPMGLASSCRHPR
ncbi:hypothetical protein BSP109_03329, partial [Brevibacterium sp. Mu109]